MKETRYFVRIAGLGPWIEVGKEQYLGMERAAGFRSKTTGEPACGSFGNGCIDGTTFYPATWNGKDGDDCGYTPATNVVEIGSDWHEMLVQSAATSAPVAPATR